jgi:acetyltransferase-like isoleucine patch superfamily enzyme
MISESAHIDCWGDSLKLGEDVNIEPFVVIIGRESIEIGDGTLVAPHVTIVDGDHNLTLPYSNIRSQGLKKPVKIGRFCWVGANSIILKGVTLGDGCIVGAGSVVTKSFPEGSVIAGNPARLLRKR